MICIELYEDQWCDVHDERPHSMSATLQGIARRFWEHCRIYAEDGYLWRPEPLSIPALVWFPLSPWMLVETGVHNPTCAVPMRYTLVGQYALGDLQAKIFDALFAVMNHCIYQPGDERDDEPADQRDDFMVGDHFDRIRGADSFLEVSRAARSILSFVQEHSNVTHLRWPLPPVI